jgi:hypothetical protein
MKQTTNEMILKVGVPVILTESKEQADGTEMITHPMRVSVKGAKQLTREMIEEFIWKVAQGKRAHDDEKLDGLFRDYVDYCILDAMGVDTVPMSEIKTQISEEKKLRLAFLIGIDMEDTGEYTFKSSVETWKRIHDANMTFGRDVWDLSNITPKDIEDVLRELNLGLITSKGKGFLGSYI